MKFLTSKHVYIAEFERFAEGSETTIWFDEDGVIMKATMVSENQGEDTDVTGFVENDKYWQQRVREWLDNYEAETKEEYEWQRGKEASWE